MNATRLQTFPDYFNFIIGTPYDVLDCWGLVVWFYYHILDMELPSYYTDKPLGNTNIHGEIVSHISEYENVEIPRFGDIVLINIYGVPTHVGIYLDNENILHTTETTGTVVDKMSRWRSRIVGYYRVKND